MGAMESEKIVKIAIAAPPWRHNSAGVRVLHYLGYLCSKLGHEVCVGSHNKLNPAWGDYSQVMYSPDLYVVPEIHGPTTRVVPTIRWCLYFPGVLGGPKFYPRHEQVVSFDLAYTESCKRATAGPVWEFYLPSVSLPGLLVQPTPDRDLPGAFWVHKGKLEWAERPVQGLVEIRDDFPTDREELVKLLRRCRMFVSYDKHSAMIEEASLCGVPEVIYWCPELKSWQEFMSHNTAWRLLMNEPQDLHDVSNFLLKIQKEMM